MDEKYTCALCGKHYATVEERNECEARCIRKQKEEAKKIAAQEKAKQQEADAKKIREDFKALSDAISEYVDKYDEYPDYGNPIEIHTGVRHPWWFLRATNLALSFIPSEMRKLIGKVKTALFSQMGIPQQK